MWNYPAIFYVVIAYCCAIPLHTTADVCSLISKLKQLEVSPAIAATFIANLGLNQRQSGLQLNNVQEISQYWLQVKGQKCTMEDLVQALLFTPGLGHLVSGLLPPSKLVCVSRSFL